MISVPVMITIIINKVGSSKLSEVIEILIG